MGLLSKIFKRKEVRRALDPETGEPIPYSPKKQIIQGYMTKLGVVIGIIGLTMKLFGYGEMFPETEINGLLSLIEVNLDDVIGFIGLATAAYGKLRRLWRDKPPPQ